MPARMAPIFNYTVNLKMSYQSDGRQILSQTGDERSGADRSNPQIALLGISDPAFQIT
jgi:hypothetical protein